MSKESASRKAPMSLGAPQKSSTIRVLPELVPANIINELESGQSNYVSTIQNAITLDLERELLMTLDNWFPGQHVHRDDPSISKKLINSAISPGQSGFDRTYGALEKTKYWDHKELVSQFRDFLFINSQKLYAVIVETKVCDGKIRCSGCKKNIKKGLESASTSSLYETKELSEWHLDCLGTFLIRELAKNYRSAKGALDKQSIAVRGILASNKNNPALQGRAKKIAEIANSDQYESWLKSMFLYWSKTNTGVKKQFHQSYESAFIEYAKAIYDYSTSGTFPIEATKQRLSKHFGEDQVNSVIEQFLTERQMAILGHIKRSIDENGVPPTMRDIGHAVGLSSPASVKYQLEKLEERGFIRKQAVENVIDAFSPENFDDSSADNVSERIITIDAKEYADARRVGEAFRSGNPVILNCSEMAEDDRKRLIDFVSGLAFASHGKIERVASKVFLITPSDVITSVQTEPSEVQVNQLSK